MSQLTGRAYISANGVRLKTRTGSKLNIGGVSRTTVSGDTGVHGYTEETMPPSIDCTISHSAETSLVEFRDMKDVSVVFEADTGKTYTISPAWVTNTIELEGGGAVALRFEGMSCEES